MSVHVQVCLLWPDRSFSVEEPARAVPYYIPVLITSNGPSVLAIPLKFCYGSEMVEYYLPDWYPALIATLKYGISPLLSPDG